MTGSLIGVEPFCWQYRCGVSEADVALEPRRAAFRFTPYSGIGNSRLKDLDWRDVLLVSEPFLGFHHALVSHGIEQHGLPCCTSEELVGTRAA